MSEEVPKEKILNVLLQVRKELQQENLKKKKGKT